MDPAVFVETSPAAVLAAADTDAPAWRPAYCRSVAQNRLPRALFLPYIAYLLAAAADPDPDAEADAEADAARLVTDNLQLAAQITADSHHTRVFVVDPAVVTEDDDEEESPGNGGPPGGLPRTLPPTQTLAAIKLYCKNTPFLRSLQQAPDPRSATAEYMVLVPYVSRAPRREWCLLWLRVVRAPQRHMEAFHLCATAQGSPSLSSSSSSSPGADFDLRGLADFFLGPGAASSALPDYIRLATCLDAHSDTGAVCCANAARLARCFAEHAFMDGDRAAALVDDRLAAHVEDRRVFRDLRAFHGFLRGVAAGRTQARTLAPQETESGGGGAGQAYVPPGLALGVRLYQHGRGPLAHDTARALCLLDLARRPPLPGLELEGSAVERQLRAVEALERDPRLDAAVRQMLVSCGGPCGGPGPGLRYEPGLVYGSGLGYVYEPRPGLGLGLGYGPEACHAQGTFP